MDGWDLMNGLTCSTRQCSETNASSGLTLLSRRNRRAIDRAMFSRQAQPNSMSTCLTVHCTTSSRKVGTSRAPGFKVASNDCPVHHSATNQLTPPGVTRDGCLLGLPLTRTAHQPRTISHFPVAAATGSMIPRGCRSFRYLAGGKHRRSIDVTRY
ncbi:hypothetical protein VTK56DRAFT_107 [Thermocarpiscus australiensis]